MTAIARGPRRTGAGVVIVGAGAAGVTVAAELRAQGFQDPVTIIGEEAELPYDRPPLSKKVLSGSWGTERAALRPPTWYDGEHIDLISGTRAVALDPDRHLISLDDDREIGYDQAVIATGLRPRTLPDTAAVSGVHTLRTLTDVQLLQATFAASARVVIVGAGFLGMEIAAVANEAGLAVTVIDPMPVPMSRGFGTLVGGRVADLHRSRGVELFLGSGLVSLMTAPGLTGRKVTGVVLTDGRSVAADCVVVAIGSVANVEWLKETALTTSDAVVVDEFMRAAPDIFAAGDLADWPSRRYDRRLRLEHRTNASEQAAVVGWNITHPTDHRAFDPIPYFWSEQYDVRIQGYGIFPPHAETEVISGSADADRFVACTSQGEQALGLIGWNSAKALMAHRPLLQNLPAQQSYALS